MKLAVVAGEASGDLHAADVVRELRRLSGNVESFGIGGDLLARQGTRILHHAREMGIVGLFNVVRHLGMFARVFRELMAAIESERPDVVLLVDYPDFNLRVARRCKKLGLRVVYYISPQLWAWRRGRVKDIARVVDHMVVILPFEEDLYRQHGVPVTYVGHPLIEQLAMIRRARPKPGVLRTALLPGSRRMEVRSLLPPMLDAVEILRRDHQVEAYVIQAPTIDYYDLEKVLRQRRADIPILPHDRAEAVSASDVALSSSGTATLECAILGTPVVVMYKLSAATYQLARRLVRLPHFSLVNIIAGREVVPELIQGEVNGERIAQEVRSLLAPERYAKVVEELLEVKARLGGPGASSRAAEAIMTVVNR
ncbi:MAG TPA: lipid-A-disaccharide synthase [Thermoanaerobaculia bacterium]|nr:lipid-A-disaccharide synthase [Thermoanaerobaculia bacterium]